MVGDGVRTLRETKSGEDILGSVEMPQEHGCVEMGAMKFEAIN